MTGHGKVLSTKAGDPYSLLLARARRDYLTQLSGSSKVGAKHGRYTLASATSALLPLSSDDTLGKLPSWVTTSLVLVPAPTQTSAES